MKKNTIVLLVLVALISLLVGGIVGYAISNARASGTGKIDNFQGCANAGNAIQQTYPETCSVPGGKTFTNN